MSRVFAESSFIYESTIDTSLIAPHWRSRASFVCERVCLRLLSSDCLQGLVQCLRIVLSEFVLHSYMGGVFASSVAVESLLFDSLQTSRGSMRVRTNPVMSLRPPDDTVLPT